VAIRKVEVKPLGDSVFDVRLEVENSGYLPTALAQGEASREVHPTRVVVNVEDKRILAGTRRVMLGTIPGSGGMKEVRWVILGRGLSTIDVDVVSMLGGTVKTRIELKEGN
jgi:hypothetical protein